MRPVSRTDSGNILFEDLEAANLQVIADPRGPLVALLMITLLFEGWLGGRSYSYGSTVPLKMRTSI